MIRPILIFLTVSSILSCSNGGDSSIVGEPKSPAPASLVFPFDNSECIEGIVKSDTKSTVTFQWEDAQNTDSYELKLKNLSTGVTVGHNVSQSEAIIELERGIAYSWYVISKNKNSVENAESPVRKFYNAHEALSSYSPFPAELVTPSINQKITYTAEGTVLEWIGSDADKDIVSYNLYFSTINPPELYKKELTTSKVVNIPVLPDTQYYWKIEATDAQGNSSYSDLFQFEVN